MKGFNLLASCLLFLGAACGPFGCSAETNAAVDGGSTMTPPSTTIEKMAAPISFLRSSSSSSFLLRKATATERLDGDHGSGRRLGDAFWEGLANDHPILLVILILLGFIVSCILFVVIFIVLPFQLFVSAWFWYFARDHGVRSTTERQHDCTVDNCKAEDASTSTDDDIDSTAATIGCGVAEEEDDDDAGDVV